ncbi:protein kinase C-binding protein NELL2-like [Contarinia nasturtii]|uniref:protein kinase C-binding protein NELL2-like n=1 Tax=Contarinia nasturtii TaxID=265458 RepID=UPI0012D404EB|nr:protein kinase C-binding protein NELL2-like [Contarinia nasturtii]
MKCVIIFYFVAIYIGAIPGGEAKPGANELKNCGRIKRIPHAVVYFITQTEIGVNCNAGYRFENNHTSASYVCSDDQWILRDFNPTVPKACTPICDPPCENNGICNRPGECLCPNSFTGSRCEIASKTCGDIPQSTNTYYNTDDGISLRFNCVEGTFFQDGTSTLEMFCNEDPREWQPLNKNGNFSIDCNTMCNLNGKKYPIGKTIIKSCNTCTCRSNGKFNCTRFICPAHSLLYYH